MRQTTVMAMPKQEETGGDKRRQEERDRRRQKARGSAQTGIEGRSMT